MSLAICIVVIVFVLCLQFGWGWARNPNGLEASPGRPTHGGPPLAWKDQDTGTVFYAETDRRHVAAVGKDGKLVWLMSTEASPLPLESSLAWKDQDTGTVFYAETDRRHVAAVGKDGKLLWVTDPTVGNSSFTGVPAEVTFIGKAEEWAQKVMVRKGKRGKYVGVAFSSKAFGLIDESTGEYTSLGTD